MLLQGSSSNLTMEDNRGGLQMKHALVMLAAVTGILAASPALAQLQKCVDPNGAVIFVNTECPAGYTLEASRPESAPSPPDIQAPPATPPETLPAPSGEPQAPPEEVDTGGLTACSEGDFEYKEGGIFFTSTRRLACLGVKAVCTFSVSRSQRVVTDGRGRGAKRPRGDAYTTESGREEVHINYTDKIGKFGTERVGDVNIRGKVTSWNCRVLN
jgi:hypothetical protein